MTENISNEDFKKKVIKDLSDYFELEEIKKSIEKGKKEFFKIHDGYSSVVHIYNNVNGQTVVDIIEGKYSQDYVINSLDEINVDTHEQFVIYKSRVVISEIIYELLNNKFKLCPSQTIRYRFRDEFINKIISVGRKFPLDNANYKEVIGIIKDYLETFKKQ